MGCSSGGANQRGDQPRIVLNTSSSRPTIDVLDVRADQLALIAGADSRDAWTAILKVAVGVDQTPAVGQYSLEGDIVRFTPMFPLEKGRQYEVTFTAPGAPPVTATVGLPPPDRTPTTRAEVYPTSDAWPENQLRLYIHFSAPMQPRSALDFVHLLDESGQEVKDPFLPLDVDFWNDDRTQYTVFFDPNYQKDGVAGRALAQGKSYTLVIDAAWPDAKRLPLTQSVKRTFNVGPRDDKPPDPKLWKIDAPAANSDAPLVVTFPEPLDFDLLMRGLAVTAAGKPVDGRVEISNHETTWSFIPADVWQPGNYSLVVSAVEDLAGNRIGRPFDLEHFDRKDQANEGDKTVIPFVIR